jgi:hypothetical protein
LRFRACGPGERIYILQSHKRKRRKRRERNAIAEPRMKYTGFPAFANFSGHCAFCVKWLFGLLSEIAIGLS